MKLVNMLSDISDSCQHFGKRCYLVEGSRAACLDINEEAALPHFTIEYSANLDGDLDVAAFCEVIRAAAAEIETFPTAGIRVRAFRAEHFAIADGDGKHAFIDMSIRLREGRTQDVKEDATARIFAAAEAFVAPIMAQRSLALSLEMREINASLSPKTGTIRDHI